MINVNYELLIPALLIATATAYYILRVFRSRKRLMMFGHIADRWGMRFQKDIFSGLLKAISGSYINSQGHNRSASGVLSGRQLNIPLCISDYRFELGTGFSRKVVNRTIFTAELTEARPSLVILHNSSLLPYSHFRDFRQLEISRILEQTRPESAVRSYLRKCHFYSDRPMEAEKMLGAELLNALGKIKSADIEIIG
ncbi:MAG: hypothetical protein JXM68_09390, partial [Sedimentisphaerales bacterium]|nr:hypothetical protein [Sedimentisphaerales bacterium]